MLVFEGREKPTTERKIPRNKERFDNKLNPYMTPEPTIEPEPHWSEVNALTTTPSLLAKYFYTHHIPLPSSCKSFDYGRGYKKDGTFQSELYMKGVGQCTRWSADQTSVKLKSCSYNYYYKKDPEPTGSAASFVPFAFLLSMSVGLTMINAVM